MNRRAWNATTSPRFRGRRVHAPDTLPSYRQSRARNPVDFPSPGPVPNRARARRGFRAFVEHGRSVGKTAWSHARAPHSLVFVSRPARHREERAPFELGRACPWARLAASHTGVAITMHPIDVCTPNTESRALRAFVGSQRVRGPLRGRARLRRVVRAHLPPARTRESRQRRARGPSMRARPGIARFTTRTPLRRSVSRTAGRCLPPRAREDAIRLWCSCRLLRRAPGPAFHGVTTRLEGRQDRLHPAAS